MGIKLVINPTPPPKARISISDLIMACNDAVGKLSNQNPHKQLIFNCAWALRQLVDRLEKFERGDGEVKL